MGSHICSMGLNEKYNMLNCKVMDSLFWPLEIVSTIYHGMKKEQFLHS